MECLIAEFIKFFGTFAKFLFFEGDWGNRL